MRLVSKWGLIWLLQKQEHRDTFVSKRRRATAWIQWCWTHPTCKSPFVEYSFKYISWSCTRQMAVKMCLMDKKQHQKQEHCYDIMLWHCYLFFFSLSERHHYSSTGIDMFKLCTTLQFWNQRMKAWTFGWRGLYSLAQISAGRKAHWCQAVRCREPT